jgi:fatty-acyl-CoA synthase
VLSVLTSVAGVLEGVVYGVQVPHADGRAGMAAILVADGFDLPAFHAAVSARLPGYARPVFLRLIAALEATGTFKPKRQDLVQAGFDPARIADRLYMDDPRARAYVPLDAVRYAALLAGDLRL